LRASFASGSVVDSCVSLLRFSPWKSTLVLLGSSGGGSSSFDEPFFLKLLRLAHASMSVPSTLKCSRLISPAAFACSTIARKNCPAASLATRRSRFFVKTVGSKLGSSMSMSRNQRNKRL
jgi:hypothetical protein